MEHPENITLFPLSGDYGSIFDFFWRCEEDSKIVTIPMVRDEFFNGDYWVAYEHVQRFWRWFLVRVGTDGYPYRFRVSGIMSYPRQYFIDAHKPGFMQFFNHFVVSMKAYDEREKRKRERRSDPARLNLTLISLDEQTDKQQPMPDIIISMDEISNESEEEEEQIEVNPSIVTEEPPLLEDVVDAPPIVYSPVTPQPHPPSSHRIAWLILSAIVIIIVISLVYLFVTRRE